MLNLVQLQERLKDVPMQALMSYANGASPQVPPFLALGELNRRKKMEDAAAAEQAQQMEGAPTIKEQIEQSTGLLALQGNRQQQAAQQQQSAQANAAMPAPNTEMSEPVQMASGGEVLPRDYQRGGMASMANPEMLKRLMLLKALQQRKQQAPGISQLPMRPGMFQRSNYAGGGIVAFNGEEDGSFVETSPSFYQLKSETQEDEDKGLSFEQRMAREQIRKIRELKSLADMKREAGLEAPPTKDVEKLAALEAQRKRFEDSDTIINRLLAVNPLQIGPSMGAYAAKQEAQRKLFEDQIAQINDLRTQAAYDAKVGDIKSSRDNTLEAAKLERELIGTSAEVGYKEKLGQAQLTKGPSNLQEMAKVEFDALVAKGAPPNEATRQQAYRNAAAFVTYAGPRSDITKSGQEITARDRARDNINRVLADFASPESIKLNELQTKDRKNEKAGNPTNLAEQYKNRLYSIEEASILGKPLPSESQTQIQPGGIPPSAVAQLKKGVITKFANGEQWTLDQSGNPQRVK